MTADFTHNIRRVGGAESLSHSRHQPCWARWSLVTTQMSDRYVLTFASGFAPASRFLRGQLLCRLYKSPLARSQIKVPRVYTCTKRSHTRVKEPVVDYVYHSLVDYGNTQITQYALKVLIFKMFGLYTMQKKIKRIVFASFVDPNSVQVSQVKGIIIIIKIFVKRKILSTETILSAYTRNNTEAPAHTSILTILS